ncbi:Type II secretion system protein G precursor [compost metagenome]
MNIRRQVGFTIVELLIVIVIIGILAAITIVAYNGIQNRGYDTAVQSDIRGLANKVMMYQADLGEYPKAGSRTGDSTKFPGMTFSASKSAYDTSVTTNLYYCDGTIAGSAAFVIMAKSKSKEVYAYSSSGGLQALGKTAGLSTVCTGLDVGSTAYSYGYNSGPTYGWFAWTNG